MSCAECGPSRGPEPDRHRQRVPGRQLQRIGGDAGHDELAVARAEPSIVSLHGPSLTSVSGRSTNAPMQQEPKPPVSAITVRSEPLPIVAVVFRSSSGRSGSSLVTRMPPTAASRPAGRSLDRERDLRPGRERQRRRRQRHHREVADPETRATSSTIRSVLPTLETVRVRYRGPRQTVPNASRPAG